MNFSGELLNTLGNQEIFLVNFKRMDRKVAGDLVFTFRCNQQDRALHRCDTGKNEIEQNKRVGVEPCVPVEQHPDAEKHDCDKYKGP